MPSAKEITNKIKSVQSTSKITKAMEMVAASKMRRSQMQMEASRPYAKSMRLMISHIALGSLEYKHPYVEERPAKRVGYIVVSTDRGLCGGLNINLIRALLNHAEEWENKGVGVDLAVIGGKATAFFQAQGGNVKAQLSGLGETPSLQDLVGTVKVMTEAFDNGELDRLYVVYNNFINTMSQKPTVSQLIPLPKSDDDELKHRWDYIYEPDAQSLLETIMQRYIESQVYQAVVENIASEQAARMVAMKAASDNASNLIDDLQLVYNKARQASITQELSEICAGAAAV